MGGGFPQLQSHGGTCHFEDCEIAHNFDDLTNIGTELSFAFKQVGLSNLEIIVAFRFDKLSYLGSRDKKLSLLQVCCCESTSSSPSWQMQCWPSWDSSKKYQSLSHRECTGCQLKAYASIDDCHSKALCLL